MEGERGRVGESTQTKMPKSLRSRGETATKRKMGKIKRMKEAKKRRQTIKKRGGGREKVERNKSEPKGRKEKQRTPRHNPQAPKIKRGF